MKFEDVQLTGSLNITGSFNVPYHTDYPNSPTEGDLFYHTVSGSLFVRNDDEWILVPFSGSSEAAGPASADIEYLVVAGGGGGGYTLEGGGGAGGLLSSSLSSIESGSSITVTVGAGGNGQLTSTNTPNNGGNSSIASSTGTSFTTVTATGGGGGGIPAGDGGSGGGARSTEGNEGSGTSGQGFDGGFANGGFGGSGGGAGEAGTDSTSTDRAGGSYSPDGGDGKQSSITGTSTYYAGGGGVGGGNAYGTVYPAGDGGAGGGGNGSYGSNSGTAGTANTGGGGGSNGYDWNAVNHNGYAGGSGVVILAYPSSSIDAVGGIVGDAGNGRKYHQFNESGILKVGSTSDFGIVTDSLVSHYNAGDFASRGTSTWTDLQGISNGSVTNATLGQNFYYSFDGSGDYIDLGSIDTFSDGEYTMEAWCKVPAFSSPALMSIFTLQDDIYAYIFIYADGSFRMNTETSSGTGNLYTSTGYDDGNWHHVVATYTPGLLSGYVDGVADGTNTTGTGNPNSNDGWSLVGGYDSSKASLSQSYPLLGDVAQIRVYNKALSAAEILQNYNATKTNFV